MAETLGSYLRCNTNLRAQGSWWVPMGLNSPACQHMRRGADSCPAAPCSRDPRLAGPGISRRLSFQGCSPSTRGTSKSHPDGTAGAQRQVYSMCGRVLIPSTACKLPPRSRLCHTFKTFEEPCMVAHEPDLILPALSHCITAGSRRPIEHGPIWPFGPPRVPN